MPDEYSLYEAKAKLSALVRQVREGASVIITVHGEPVAELRPYEPRATDTSIHDRIETLRANGEFVRAAVDMPRELGIRRVAKVRGALRRFLSDRD